MSERSKDFKLTLCKKNVSPLINFPRIFQNMSYTITVLADGYSKFENGVYKANGSCSLIVGPKYKVIVDTMSAWDKEKLLGLLSQHHIVPEERHEQFISFD